ncbi:MAG TPA: S16 family serine protease, partial [Thermomicrobiales bacterium]|nr:S16 family serine protease [Thermomicrobiales bacterium]
GEPVAVDALWFASDGQSVQGGTSRVVVSVNSKDDQDLRVGFFESEVGGSGPQWRAAGWMAVITASLLIGNDPSHYEFSFDVAGRIDGPSAGALMTIAVLAGYLGDEIDPTVTMTGTINPDGTIGPVGGIPHKIEGAAAAGKTTVLVPGGQRYDYDYALGQSVDLVQVGQQNGVEVKLVSDIYDAYRELTGSELPAPANTGQAAFPSSAFDKYRAGATNWYATYQSEVNDFYALPADVQEYRLETIQAADYYAGMADQYLGEGQIAAAYENAFTAAALARVAREAAELDNIYYQQGIGPLVDRLNSSSSAQTRMSAVSQRLEAETPRTAADSIAIMDAFSNLSVAQGLIFQADAALNDYANNPDATEDDALTAIYAANYNYVYADMYLDLAEDGLGIGLGFGNSPAPSLEVLTAISETLRRGAEANITYFESLIIDPWAQQYGIHPDLAKYYFQQSDNSYLTAVAAVAGASSLAGTMLKPEAQASVNLGSALTAYSQSASLIAKYYSLSAQVDESGSVVGYDRQSSLVDMLDLADQRAQQWLGAVAGEDPVQSLYYYDNARLLRSGTPDDQLSALNYFWQSAILSETLAVFATPAE